MLTRIVRLFWVVAFGVAASATAGPGTEGTVNGWLEVKGERLALTHVFAAAETDRLEGDEKENVVVLLTDKPVPDELRGAGKDYTMWAAEQARAGQLNGVIVMIDPQTNVWSRGQRLSKEHGLTFYFHSSTSPEGRKLRFEPAPAGETRIAGKVSMTEPMGGIGESEGPWRLEAEFSAAVAQQEAVTARLTGAQARNSPQYKAAMAFVQASKRKDVEAIKKTMDAPSQAMFAEMVQEMGRAGALKMLSEMAGEALRMKDAEVVVRGSRAEVRLKKSDAKSKDEITLQVVLDQGVWKMAR